MSSNTKKTVDTKAEEVKDKKKGKEKEQTKTSAPRAQGKLTHGEIALNLGSVLSILFLGSVAVYNMHLYHKIFGELLPLPWPWLQKAVGLTAWATIQIAELLPFLIRSEVGFMALIAISTSAMPKVKSSSADPIVTRMARRINTFPQRWLWLASMIGSFVFGLDLIMVSYWFKPIQWTFIFPSISITAIFQVLMTVTMFQLAFMFCLFTANGRWFLRNGKQSMGNSDAR